MSEITNQDLMLLRMMDALGERANQPPFLHLRAGGRLRSSVDRLAAAGMIRVRDGAVTVTDVGRAAAAR